MTDRPGAARRSLTRREREILELLREPGTTEDAVAAALGIELQSVKNHLQNAYRTLGVRSRRAALELLAEA